MPVTTCFVGVTPWWHRNASAGARIWPGRLVRGRDGGQHTFDSGAAPSSTAHAQGAGRMDAAIKGNHNVTDGAVCRELPAGDQHRPDRAPNHAGHQRIDRPVIPRVDPRIPSRDMTTMS